jgi:Protein of unknown function (DUF3667)
MDELGKSFPMAEGVIDAEQSGAPKQHNEFCLNCGTKLLDTFCQHCGQKDIPKRQTLGELWTNFISSFWSYEGKFFLTTKFLITKPGFLALEYNAGRRESYYHPARMYVFISFVFFLLFSISTSSKLEDSDKANKNKTVELDSDDLKELKEDHPSLNVDSIFRGSLSKDSSFIVSKALLDSIKKLDGRPKKKKNVGFTLSDTEFKSIEAYDSTQHALAPDKRDGWLELRLKIRNIELQERYKDGDFGSEFGKAFLENFSKVLFFLLPVFALLLKLLYVRKDYFYSEHLVFSIYYYNFFYLAGSVQILASYFDHLTLVDWAGNIISLWIMVYLLFAMKRMYQQTWRKTILKYLIFGFMFLICVVIGFSINALFLLFLI